MSSTSTQPINIPVNKPESIRMLLNILVDSLDEDANVMDMLLVGGVDAGVVDHLRHCPARDITSLANFRNLNLKVQFSPAPLVSSMRSLNQMRRDKELCEYFVANGASVALVSSYFNIAAQEVRELRSVLLPISETKAGGRSPKPPEAVKDQIYAKWVEFANECPEWPLRERMFYLHKHFHAYSIDSLNSTLQEFPSV